MCESVILYIVHHGNLWINKKSMQGCTLNVKTKLISICGLLQFCVQKFQSIIYKEWTLYTKIKIHTHFFQTTRQHSIASNGV